MEDIQQEVTSLNDSALRMQLMEAQIPVGPIVASTRPIFVKKLVEYRSKQRGISPSETPSPVRGEDQRASSSKIEERKGPSKDTHVSGSCSPQTSTPKRPGSDSYFVVCIPTTDCGNKSQEFVTPSKAVSYMFEDQKEALKLLKKNPGARFKVFRSRKDAESFAGLRENLSTPRSVEVERKEKNLILPKPAQDSPNEFHSPKAQQYVALRKAIINQDKERLKELVWSNPKYLISTGDTPTILQESSRYNAVHICAQKNLPEMCALVLDTVQNSEFMQLIYPDEPEQMLTQRMNHIVDLYINVPDKGNCETPLHFACKFGNIEMVEFLLSYRICERDCTNRYGQTAAEITCSRNKTSGEEQVRLKKKIMELLDPADEEVFIPVFRSEDNTSPPHIGQPWSPASCNNQSGQSFDSLKSPVDIDWCVKAFAGPMSPKEASDLYQKWKGRLKGRNDEDRDIQRSDDEKGLERIGRKLSQSAGVPWREYWDFLDVFLDLATPEGLQTFEDYLTVKYKELQQSCMTQTDDVVKDLNIQFDVMNINEPTINNNAAGLLDDNCVVTPNSEQCASVNRRLEQDYVQATNSKCEQTEKLNEHDRQNDISCGDNSELSVEIDSLCKPFSNMMVGDGYISENKNCELLEAGDGCRSTRANFTTEMDHTSYRLDSIKDNTSMDHTSDMLDSPMGTTSMDHTAGSLSPTSTDGSVSENVFSSPEQGLYSDLSKRDDSFKKVGCIQVKKFYIIGNAPSRRDIDVYRALQHVHPADKFPFVRKWKSQIEDVADHLRLKWPTPRRKLRRSVSNPHLPASPMTSQNPVFTFSPLSIDNHHISCMQLRPPSSGPHLTSPRHQQISSPVARLILE